MMEREFWISQIKKAWEEAPIVWLTGVRRSGKTTLIKSLPSDNLAYFDCDFPYVEDMVRDPALFYSNQTKPFLVFDEIHQLKDPSRLLKIGADHYPQFKILATGSSTLAASDKFKDTLTGRKRVVHLPPVLWSELTAFGQPLEKRLYHGGLPPALLAEEKKPGFYREWLDSFFARDVQKTFHLRSVEKFNHFFEYILKQSSGQFETAKASRDLQISRPTIESYLNVLVVTHAAHILRPYHGGGRSELTKTPKIYAFDTGFVSFARGWDPLRPADSGFLWEHLVLDFLRAASPNRPLAYWRDISGREIDFVLPQDRDTVDAIECKWDPTRFDPTALDVFRRDHPRGRNFVIHPSPSPSYQKSFKGHTVSFLSPSDWQKESGC